MDKLLIAAACLLLGALATSVSASPTGQNADPVTPESHLSPTVSTAVARPPAAADDLTIIISAGRDMADCVDAYSEEFSKYKYIEDCQEFVKYLDKFFARLSRCDKLEGSSEESIKKFVLLRFNKEDYHRLCKEEIARDPNWSPISLAETEEPLELGSEPEQVAASVSESE